VIEQLPILYNFRRCPYAMRARLALAASGQAVELREVELRNRPEDLYAASAKGTVPVLVLPDGQVVDESLEIMHWALGKSDPMAWLPVTAGIKNECEALLGRNDGAFKHHLDRYKYATRYDDVDEVEHREKAAQILRDLDERLRQHNYLLCDDFTLADAAVAPFVRQYAIADRAYFDGQEWVALRAWLDGFASSDRFLAIMQKYPVWHKGDDARTVDWRLA
jgi:glutathione S-transferase